MKKFYFPSREPAYRQIWGAGVCPDKIFNICINNIYHFINTIKSVIPQDQSGISSDK
jgi:hypothetical protein